MIIGVRGLDEDFIQFILENFQYRIDYILYSPYYDQSNSIIGLNYMLYLASHIQFIKDDDAILFKLKFNI